MQSRTRRELQFKADADHQHGKERICCAHHVGKPQHLRRKLPAEESQNRHGDINIHRNRRKHPPEEKPGAAAFVFPGHRRCDGIGRPRAHDRIAGIPNAGRDDTHGAHEALQKRKSEAADVVAREINDVEGLLGRIAAF